MVLQVFSGLGQEQGPCHTAGMLLAALLLVPAPTRLRQ